MSEILKFRPITSAELAAKGVVALADRPNQQQRYGSGGLSAKDLKKWFDNLSELMAQKINEIQGVLASDKATDYIALEKAYGEIATLGDLIRAMESGLFARTVMQAKLEDSTMLLDNVIGELAARIGTNSSDIDLIFAEIAKQVATEKIADGAVTEAKIADRAVTEAKLASSHLAKVQGSLQSVSYNGISGVLTFTSADGKTQTVDLPVEQLLSTVYFSEGKAGEDEDDAIVFVFNDGSTVRVPTSAMLTDLMEYAQGLREGYYTMQKAPPLSILRQSILFPPPTLAQIWAEQNGG